MPSYVLNVVRLHLFADYLIYSWWLCSSKHKRQGTISHYLVFTHWLLWLLSHLMYKKKQKKKTVCSVIHRPISDVKCLYFFPNTLNDPDMDNYYKRDEVVWLKALWPHFIQRKLDSIELNTVWHYLKEYSGFKSSSVNRFGIMLICHGN